MKKIYSLAIAGLLAGGISAQSSINNPVNNVKPKPSHVAQFDKAKFSQKFQPVNPNVAAPPVWVNYGVVIDQVLGGGAGMTGPAALSSNYLNTDSLLYGDFGGTMSSIWCNHLGDVFDIKSQYFTQILGTNWSSTTAYTVDSASIVYAYIRNSAPTVVDTLIFSFYQNVPAANLVGNGFIGATAANYGTDTISVKLMKYTFGTNSPNASSITTVKVPLTDQDTAIAFYGEKYFELKNNAGVVTPYAVGANKLMACAVTFKPGFSYALGDSAEGVGKNAFFFTSYEENGDGGGTGTFQTYTDCNYQSGACDYNSSHLAPIDVRYNQAGTWNGYFIPSYAYTVGYGFEHHLISYHVVETPVGMNEVKNNQFSLEQNVPNPFSTSTIIDVTLKNAAKTVTFEVTDFFGRSIISQTDNNLKPGDYKYAVDANKLSRGIYFYSINVDGNRVSKKMIVE
ncbi:MAG: T9SS type A sorting domain-containing protein [Bacteroidia bacterium]|nr:T9SS type A sorting domain-containing protein [Bacteroidia bacterium]